MQAPQVMGHKDVGVAAQFIFWWLNIESTRESESKVEGVLIGELRRHVCAIDYINQIYALVEEMN